LHQNERRDENGQNEKDQKVAGGICVSVLHGPGHCCGSGEADDLKNTEDGNLSVIS
jgi:hypothetical protein